MSFTKNAHTHTASYLPSPPVDPEIKNPGGFQPYVPPPHNADTTTPPTAAQRTVQPWSAPAAPPAGSVQLTPEQLVKAQKYCKWAGSALTYDDIGSAIENLQKGLHLLQCGTEMP